MSTSAAEATTRPSDPEKGTTQHSERLPRAVTPGGHPVDYSQPAIPSNHRKYGNPAPLGLTSFGCGFFVVSCFTLYTRGIQIPNVAVPILIFYGGMFQSLVGLFELFLGNTFGATVFCTYGAFNFSYAGLYLPQLGVVDAYLLADGSLSPQFNQAVGVFLIAWMIVTWLFVLGALRSSGAVLSTLVFTALALMFLAIWQFTGSDAMRIAGGSFGMCASWTAWWGAMAGFWSPDATFRMIKVDPVMLSRK